MPSVSFNDVAAPRSYVNHWQRARVEERANVVSCMKVHMHDASQAIRFYPPTDVEHNAPHIETQARRAFRSAFDNFFLPRLSSIDISQLLHLPQTTTMHRVKRIEYNDDDVYSEEEDDAADEQGYTDEDRSNLANLTPVVRAELQEAGLQASDREIEDALWHYYWDVGKSVAYLKNTRTPRPQQQQQAKKKEKAKSKFDEAAEKSAENAGELMPFL